MTCQKDKVLNPKTGKCVLRTGKIGQEILKSEKKPIEPKVKPDLEDKSKCSSDKVLNPKTGKCVLRTGKIGQEILKAEKKPVEPEVEPKVEDKCSSDKVLNPKTGKCVLRTGKIGQEILKAEKKPVEQEVEPKVEDKCSSDKVLNPKTGKCVLRTGKIGQEILNNYQAKPKLDDEYIKNAIQWNEWFIVTKKGCGYCNDAKRLLTKHNFVFEEFEVNNTNVNDLYKIISKYTGGVYQSFPMIFFIGHFIGGHTDLVKILPEILKKLDKVQNSTKLTSKLHMSVPKLSSKTTFQGTAWYDLVAMLYLHYKYPKACIVIPDPLSDYKLAITKNTKDRLHLRNLELIWVESKNDFSIPKGLWKTVKNCLDSDADFIILPLTLGCKYSSWHANILIYDKRSKELERFEPNGYIIESQCYNPVGLNNKIKDLFNNNVKKDMIKTVYEPQDFCPYFGFQRIQAVEKGEKKDTDPYGFCAAWTMWYADVRLANPNKSRDKVIELAMEKIKSNPDSFTSFIRSYAEFLVQTGGKLESSENPSKTFAQMLSTPSPSPI